MKKIYLFSVLTFLLIAVLVTVLILNETQVAPPMKPYLTLQIDNGTCNVILAQKLILSNSGSHWDGPNLFSSTNITEATEWAMNYTR